MPQSTAALMDAFAESPNGNGFPISEVASALWATINNVTMTGNLRAVREPPPPGAERILRFRKIVSHREAGLCAKQSA